MTEQELIQENEKLNQRLTKAIEVFKEQKENIVRLTQERDEAKGALDKKEATITELRVKLDEKSSSDEKFFEQVNEIQGLKRSVQELEKAFDEAKNTIEQKDQQIEKLQTEAAGFQMQVDTANKLLADNENLMNNKLKALNDIIDETKTALEESQKQNGTLNERLNNAAAKFKEQEETIETQKANLDTVQKLLDEANAKNKEAEIDYASKVEELNAVREAYEKSQNMLADTQSKMDAHVAELQATIAAKDKEIAELKNKDTATQTQISEVKTKIQEINRLGSDLVNNFNMFA